MRRWVFVLVLLASVAYLPVSATLPDATFLSAASPLQLQHSRVTPQGLELSLGYSAPVWGMVNESGSEVQVAEFLNGALLEEEGMPVIPVASRMFRIPARSGVRVEVVSADYETLTDIDYAVFFSDGADGLLGRVSHPVDEWYPGTVASVTEPALMKDFRVSNLHTFPVQVNTARREVRVYSNIEVSLHFEGEDARNQLSSWPTRISEAFLPWYRQLLDWDDAELDQYELYRGQVLVVMRDHDALLELFSPWLEWKRQKGFELNILTDDDVAWTSNAIKDELVERYENSDPPP